MKLLRFISSLLAVYIIVAIVILAPAPAAVSYGIVTDLLDSETLKPVSDIHIQKRRLVIWKQGNK